MNLASLQSEYADIQSQLTDVTSLSPADQARLFKRADELREILQAHEKVQKLSDQLSEASELIVGGGEMAELAKSEAEELAALLETAKAELLALTLPRDPHEASDAIVEIRAGAGGGPFAG